MRKAVIAPPVITPSEVPAGPFLLAAGLRARGVEAPVHDLSLGFFLWLFTGKAVELGLPNCRPALDYLRRPPGGVYDPHGHRSFCGVLQSVLKRYSARFPGWQLSLMDSVPPGTVHSVRELSRVVETQETPFTEYLEKWIEGNGNDFDHVFLSISYISQLPAALETAALLRKRRKRITVGGSLLSALKQTGRGIGLLEECFSEVRFDDGRSLLPNDEPLLRRLVWPEFALDTEYLSSRTVIPYPITTGCVWNRCLFCPDRSKELYRVPGGNLASLLDGADDDPVVHFIDSAMPVEGLRELLPVLRERTAGFYGFARPEGKLLDSNIIPELAGSGCLMLQTGLESGSGELLRKYSKGFLPGTAGRVIESAHEEGMLNYVYLLFGLPGETDAHRRATLALTRKLSKSIDFLNLSVFNLPEVCELSDRAEEFGIIPGEYDPSFEVLRFYKPFKCLDGTDPRMEARTFLRETFRKDPEILMILQNTPRWFRAGHMALMKKDGAAF